MDTGVPAAEKQVDANFFNAFRDPFDEDDMKPAGSATSTGAAALAALGQPLTTPNPR